MYALLLRAMEHSGLAGIAKFVMRDRQNLGALRVRDGVIILEQMFFADEIRPLDELKPRKAAVSKEELAMAEQLIDNFAADFKPKKYKDTYGTRLARLFASSERARRSIVLPRANKRHRPTCSRRFERASSRSGATAVRDGSAPRETARATICRDCRNRSSTSARAKRRSPDARRSRSMSWPRR